MFGPDYRLAPFSLRMKAKKARILRNGCEMSLTSAAIIQCGAYTFCPKWPRSPRWEQRITRTRSCWEKKQIKNFPLSDFRLQTICLMMKVEKEKVFFALAFSFLALSSGVVFVIKISRAEIAKRPL